LAAGIWYGGSGKDYKSMPANGTSYLSFTPAKAGQAVHLWDEFSNPVFTQSKDPIVR